MPSKPIAIVGISVELPAGHYAVTNLDHASFFDFLMSSGQAYESIPSERLNIETWKGLGTGKIHTDKGSFLKDIDLFDNVEFGISSKDSQAMTPAARKLLEHSFLALLDSGIDYRTKPVGCFTAGSSFDILNVSEPDEYDAKGSFAGTPSMIANRISNHLDLVGPSLPVDTACSSSLTAMHLAAQALSNGDCESAVVGGCQLNHRFVDWINYSQGSLLAKDGKCKPFDSQADGFSRAEGCVVVVIKLLEQAIADHDHIYATILGTAINSTGGAAPPGAPVAEYQRQAMLQAFQRAEKDPREVDYVELHATGTAKGDPTEANWVGESFGRNDDLLIGSVKGNIGHTEITAFLASLSKVISSFERGIIPPQVNVQNPNPAIHWEKYRMKVPLQAEQLPCRSNAKSLISIASSGIGGSNGHVVLESPPKRDMRLQKVEMDSKRPVVIMAGGLSSKSTLTISESIQDAFEQDASDLPGLSTVLGRRSKQMTWRSYTIVDADRQFLLDFSTPRHCPRNSNSLVYVFSGQGPQHIHMGRELFKAFPVFRQSILEMDKIFLRTTGKSIIHDHGLFGELPCTKLPDIWPIALVLPSVAVFQMALFDLLVSVGMKPDAVVGHSAGETAVLYASGAAPRAMAVELAVIRGNSFTPIEQLGGTMAAVSCSAEDMDSILAGYRSSHPDAIVEIACYNSPSAVAIAGDEVAIDDILQLAESAGIFARKIRTRMPFHSSLMEKAKDKYTASLRDLFSRYLGPIRPQIPVYSTLTGDIFMDCFDFHYFWDNTVGPVQFTAAIDSLCLANPSSTFIEIAPHPILSSYVSTMVPETSSVLHSLQRPSRNDPPTEVVDILHLCGKVTAAGHNCIDFTTLNNRACFEFTVPLPRYPFSKKKYPLYPETAGVLKQMYVARGPLNHENLRVNKETHPTLAEHVIRGEPIMPAAGFLEMALEFGASTLMNVNLRSILSLSSEKPLKVTVKLDGVHWSVTSSPPSIFKDIGISQTEQLHADGYLSFETPSPTAPLDIVSVRNRCDQHVGSELYHALSYFSSYGPRFQRTTNAYYNRNEVLASIKGTDHTLDKDGKYLLHPAILDACIQILTFRPFHGDNDPNAYYLPARFDAVIVHQALKASYFPSHIYSYATLKKWSPRGISYDVLLVNDSGIGLCSLIGLEVARHHFNPLADISRPLEVITQPAVYGSRSKAEVHPKSTDQSDISSMLDKITLCTAIQKGGKRCLPSQGPTSMSQQRTAYLEPRTNAQVPPRFEDLLFKRAIESTQRFLRNVLQSQAAAGAKIVRILILDNVNAEAFSSGISEMLKDFPSLYTDIYIYNKDSPQILPSVPSGMIRGLQANFVNSDLEKLEGKPFDIVLSLNVTNSEVPPQILAETLHRILVPGGTCIINDRNLDAWDGNVTGAGWYNAVFGSPSSGGIYSLRSFTQALDSFNISTLNLEYSQDVDPFHFSIEAQKAVWSHDTNTLFDAADDFTYDYAYGNEEVLQWEFSGLNVLQRLDIWILTTAGRDGGAAQGLVRAIRREYSSWTIRLVIFPALLEHDARQRILAHLPQELHYEEDFFISAEGINALLVPRIAPIPSIDVIRVDDISNVPIPIPPNHVSVRILSASTQGRVAGILALVLDSNSTELQEGQIVVGLVSAKSISFGGPILTDAAALCLPPSQRAQGTDTILALVPGLVTGILAPGISTFQRPQRLAHARILLTHCDTPTGYSVKTLFSKMGIHIDALLHLLSLYELSQVGATYDLIITGYMERPYLQVLQTLLESDRGHIFMWNDEKGGLPGILHRDPCSVGHALQCAFGLMGPELAAIDLPETLLDTLDRPPLTQISTSSLQRKCVFSANKTYLILGGIGSIGAHLALFMYERGARNIVLTSRSGRRSLEENPNLFMQRMFAYLESKSDLQISLLAVDAKNSTQMRALRSSLEPSIIGGCILLTAVLSDRTFSYLTADDFANVMDAKLGVFSVFKDTFDPKTLDFIIGFTSVSGLFGKEGQANYGAANTTLEEELSQLPNAFSFVCPGILDSTMFTRADDGKGSRLRNLIPWSISAEDMVRWFDDALFRYQHGQRVIRYLPDIDWEALESNLGVPIMGSHFLPAKTTQTSADEDSSELMSKVVMQVLDIPTSDFSPDVPLTTYGIDSLSASRMSFLLRPFLQITQIQLLANISLNDLIRLASNHDDQPVSRPSGGPTEIERSSSNPMSEMLGRYSAGMTDVLWSGPKILPERESVILITGTTGILGSHILAQALENHEIRVVYALNRVTQNGPSSFERQATAFAREGLPVSLLHSPKLVQLEGDLTAKDLGLPKEVTDTLRSSLTHIIHNAWKVDFVSSLAEYEDLICGTRQLINFANQSTCHAKPSLSYVSTIGIYQGNKTSPHSEHPESPITEPNFIFNSGYTESKWIAETLFNRASSNLGLQTNVIRVGLLTGGVNGTWAPSQWFPAMVQSATYLGCLPEGDDIISWIPVNVAAKAIIEMRQTMDQTLHLIHPKPSKWNTVMAHIAKLLNVPLVPYKEWLARLESSAQDEDIDDSIIHGQQRRTALKLMHYYRTALSSSRGNTESLGLLQKVASERGIKASPTLQDEDIARIDEKDAEKWVLYWKGIGFLYCT